MRNDWIRSHFSQIEKTDFSYMIPYTVYRRYELKKWWYGMNERNDDPVWMKEMMKLGMGSNEINEFNAKFDCNHGNRMEKNWLTIFWFV